MKGMVFTEFLDFVSQKFDDDTVDDIIADANPPNGGAYTSVGTYDHRELQALITALVKRTGADTTELLRGFGRYLCTSFHRGFPSFFERTPDLFDFLESVDRHIHVEVRKLYPDAELPTFKTHARDAQLLELDYRSCRPLAALAEGLILGAADHYKQSVRVRQAPLSDQSGNYVRLSIQRVA